MPKFTSRAASSASGSKRIHYLPVSPPETAGPDPVGDAGRDIGVSPGIAFRAVPQTGSVCGCLHPELLLAKTDTRKRPLSLMIF
jgi:hypothetical protein